jgi:hypothetical protein
MAFPIGSIINQVPHAPYDSQRDALLYEILQALGGNPEEIMMKAWTAGNEGNNRPPYNSLTDALLYEIWMVIQQGEPGPGGGANASTIYYGIIKNGSTIVPSSGTSHKIITTSGNYFIVPPAISNLSGNENTNVRLWVAEPTTEPVKSATLWLRNFQSTFTNQLITANGLMSSETIGSFRVYVSEEIPAQMFNGEHFGPVFFSKARTVTVDFGVGGPPDTEPEPNLLFVNNSGDGNLLLDVSVNGVYGTFDIVNSFPLENTQQLNGFHSGFTGTIGVKTTKIGINEVSAELFKNNVQIDSIIIPTGAEIETNFLVQSFDILDDLKIELVLNL